MTPSREEHENIQERFERLKLRNASGNLNLFGKILVDEREITLWEYDTLTLPRGARKWRRKALRFAREEIRPRAPEADIDPYSFRHEEFVKAAAKKGFLSLLLPFPLGRASIPAYMRNTALQTAVIAEEFATECGGLCLMLLAHNLGIAPILLSGSVRSLLSSFIPMYIRNTWTSNPQLMAFAITEPDAGSDVEDPEGGARARLVTTARKVKGGYILNGRKCFITGGAVASKITVYAKLEGEALDSWTCFIVEKGMKGFSVGRKEKKMGQRASDASELIFEDLFLPNRNMVGKLRSGWANNLNVLNYSRPVVAAMALGHGRGAFERALDFCRKNSLGGKPLIEYRDVQMELADMVISLQAARSTVWQSLRNFRCQQTASSTAKVFASDTAFKVCSQAMELIGDHGYIHANGVERSMRDARLTQIYEGTNQLNRLAVLEHQWDVEFRPDIKIQ